MATKVDLYRQLCDTRRSGGLGSEKYIPNNKVLEIVVRDNIITELDKKRKRRSCGWMQSGRSSGDLADRILETGRKLFVILVNLGLPWGIKNLLNAGLTDEDLPLCRQDKHLMSSRNPTKIFEWPAEWEEQKLDDFVEKRQWLVLAPVFHTEGAHREFSPECPLPFEIVDEAQNDSSNVVYKALIHPSHHEGFEVEAPSLEVALKEFRFQEDFALERSNLMMIRGLTLNKHITQHFETFSCDKNYIIFPWAGGGDLDNFWKNKDVEARSPQLALWCLQQMLGLTEALETLHNQTGNQANIRHGDQAGIRHGDLKPGNILHFLTGGPYGILKIADFGISRFHNVGTLQRHGIATTTRATTPSYQAPEAIFTDRPRSRKFDIWSLGCIFLEFTIWVVHHCEAVEKFNNDRKPTVVGDDVWAHFYQRKDNKVDNSTVVHPAVVDNVKDLRRVDQCAKDTAFGEVLDIIEFQLLRIEVEDRVDAKTLCQLLTAIFKRAQEDQAYLFKDSEV